MPRQRDFAPHAHPPPVQRCIHRFRQNVRHRRILLPCIHNRVEVVLVPVADEHEHLAEVAERFWRNPLRCGQLFPLPPHPVVKHQQRFTARHREPAVVVVFHRHLFRQE